MLLEYTTMVVDGYLLDIFINVWPYFEKKVKYVMAMDKIFVNFQFVYTTMGFLMRSGVFAPSL